MFENTRRSMLAPKLSAKLDIFSLLSYNCDSFKRLYQENPLIHLTFVIVFFNFFYFFVNYRTFCKHSRPLMKEIILQKCNFRCRENIYICRPLRRLRRLAVEYVKNVLYTTETDVCIEHMVASWTCEVTLILTQKRLLQCFFVWGFL